MFAAQDLEMALGQLPDDYRTAVLLAFVEGFSYREIATIMDCPIGTVMSRICRARRRLRKLLSEEPAPGHQSSSSARVTMAPRSGRKASPRAASWPRGDILRQVLRTMSVSFSASCFRAKSAK